VNPIEFRPIAKTSVTVSRLGVGTASLGDVFGPVADDAATGVVQECVAAGISYLDTAPLYGNGTSEERLGRALSSPDLPPMTLSTKAGRTLDPTSPNGFRFDYSPDAIRRGLDDSLSRLGRERIDILYIHDPDDHAHAVYHQAWPTLLRLKAEGLVGAIGFGMNQWQLPLEFVSRLQVDVVMIAGRYTLLDPSAGEEFLPACQERGVSVVVAGVFNSGILVNPVAGSWYDYKPATAPQIRRAREIRALAARHGVELPAVALHFALRHPAVTSVVVGAGSADTVRRNVDAAQQSIPEELWMELVEQRLVSA